MERPRLDALTGARFLAALLVFSLHMTLLVPWGLRAGYSGVTFFFVLSGFVMTWAHGDLAPRLGQLLRYAGNRVGRIVPVFWLAFVVSVPVALHDFHRAWGVAGLAAVLNVLLLQAWSHRAVVNLAYDSPSWTLSVEMFFYALFPAAAVALRQVRSGRAALGLAAAVLALEAGLTAALAHATRDPMSYWIYTFPPLRLPEFLIGALLARRLQTAGPGRGAPAVLAAGIVWVAASLALDQALPDRLGLSRASLAFLPGYAAVVWGLAAAPRTRVAAWLASPRLVRLGDASYAFYLLHQLVLRYVHGALLHLHANLGAAEAAVVVLGCLGVAVMLSLAVYRWFETPCRRWVRARAAAWAESGAPAPAPAPGAPPALPGT